MSNIIVTSAPVGRHISKSILGSTNWTQFFLNEDTNLGENGMGMNMEEIREGMNMIKTNMYGILKELTKILFKTLQILLQ